MIPASTEQAIAPILPYAYGWSECFSLLSRHGFAPREILDVGANHGHFTRAAIRFFPAARYLLVEPQGHLKSEIEDLVAHGHNVRWITAGVSDKPGVLPLTVAPDDVSSNFGMTPGEAAAAGYKQTSVEIKTINDIVANCGGIIPDLVKIDAEGFDLKALAGASNILGRSEIFFVEAAVCATGIENTMAAVIPLMTKAGYKLIDITDLNRSPKHGVLWLCELVFLRSDSPLLAKVSSYR
jgi:FkbM family methyltransferase